ncbi:hypothetical protein, partial [Actinoplanes sp. NPDC026670]|uniref:hypothetical protein n=1 Tax=Actinoplanes sp. NPDC026670 TaxID=3154700 RepID=UPI0033C7FBF4
QSSTFSTPSKIKEEGVNFRGSLRGHSSGSGDIVENLLNSHLPDEEGALLSSYDPVQECSHRVGRALHAISDEALHAAVREDVQAEIAAVEMAERGYVAGRAIQAVVLSRAGANPLHVSAADAVLQEDPLDGRLLFEAFDPTAAAVAAAHWLKAAVDVVARAFRLDAARVLSAADDIEAFRLEAPMEVLSLLEFSNTVYSVIVEIVGDAMQVAGGVVPDLEAVLLQREDDEPEHVLDNDDSDDDLDEPQAENDEPTPVRVTLLDPLRPAPDLLEDLVSAIKGCRILYGEYVDGEVADVDAQFCEEVRAEAEEHAARLL